MKNKKTSRKDLMLKIAVWLLPLLFWGIIIFQLARQSIFAIVCGVIYSVLNFYSCYATFKEAKKTLKGFLIGELIPLLFIIIIAILQAII